MFTTRCFIRKNTPELRKKLEEFGYKNRHLSMSTNIENYPLLLVYHDGYYQGVFGDECGLEFYIDCGDNEELFLAIAALRDDTDIYQWFVMDVEEYMEINQGDWFLATDRNKGKHIGTQIDPMCCHKATVKELIEHFKD